MDPARAPNNYFVVISLMKMEVEIPRTNDAWREIEDQVALQVLDSSLASFVCRQQSKMIHNGFGLGIKSFVRME
jgi:hypothetical protein